jgi:NAD(P)-dependent dehydrogenase (short-subunit alcohol dehydrogenase family)
VPSDLLRGEALAVPPPGPSFQLRGKVALVTGALGFLGREHCRALMAAGAEVVVTDLDADGCRRYAADLELSVAGRALGVELDVTRAESVLAVRERVLGTFGRLDVLVNNAAIDHKFTPEAGDSAFENYALEEWQRALDVNVTGVFLCCQILGTPMAERRVGSIINIASTYGVVAPDQSIYRKPDGSQTFFKSAAYPATKGAVLAFTRFLAAYWGRSGVRVNALSPGGVLRDQESHFVDSYASRTPLGRMASPHELRGALVFLASDASSYVTGANLLVDGGWTAW